MTLDILLDAEARQRGLKERADLALQEGRITPAEHAFFLRTELGAAAALRPQPAEQPMKEYAKRKTHAEHKRETLRKVVATFLALGLLLGFLYVLTPHSQLTGLVTFEPTQPVTTPTALLFNASGAAALNVVNTTSLKLTGSLANGSADVYLVAGTQRLLVYHGDASPPAQSVSTPKQSYALGEALDIVVVPADSSYTFWLTDESGEKVPIDAGYLLTVPGVFTLDALINDSDNITKASTSFIVRNDSNVSNDVAATTTTNTLAFSGACIDTCDIPATGDAALSLDVTLSPGAVLTISSVTAAQPRANHAPVQTATVPDVTVAAGERATLDLSEYFADPDNDSLTYDFMNAPGVTMSVAGSTLSVTGVAPGSQQSVIYASDLYSITQSNPFTITVTAATTNKTTLNATEENVTNTTTTNLTNENATTNLTTTTNEINSTTTNETGNTTNETAPPVPVGAAENLTNSTNTTLDCTNPDPNQRPIDCLIENSTKYLSENIYWENVARVQVARITPIGNLLITGKVVSRSAGSPSPGDFTITYTDDNFNDVATVWIDSATGDLHLRGSLHEENANLVPPPGSYAVINRRGVYLAWADPATGDLYLRGNVIPYRENITE